MKLTRNIDREQFLFDSIRRSFAASDLERHKTIHLSDLLSPRQAYWKRVCPLPLEEKEVSYFIIGRGHEDVMHHISGLSKVSGRTWNGISYGMDFFEPGVPNLPGRPIEHKTRRGYLAKEGEELDRYSHYIAQLRGYCACEYLPQGELWIWSLVEKVADTYRSEPKLACYDVDFTPEELEAERTRLATLRDALVLSLSDNDFHRLPMCEDWMCVQRDTKIQDLPHCETCDRDFGNDYLLRRHKQAPKSAHHKVRFATYIKTVEPKCKYFSMCQPIPISGQTVQEIAGDAGL